MERGINITLHNKFDIEVRNASTGELKQQVTAYNIVLDAMWTRILARNTFMSAIHIGTGTGTLDPARTSLFTLLVARSATWDSTGSILPNLYRRVKIQLEPSEYVGSTITEVGVAYGTTSSNLVTHALLTDSEGNPISITKTSTEVVVIYATIFFTVGTLPSYVKLTGISSTGSASGNQLLASLFNQSWSLETDIRLGTYADTLAATLPTSLRGSEIATKTATLTTDAATKKINFPVRRFEVAEANTLNGAIQEIAVGGSFNIQLPNENYTGTTYTDIILSGQDGSKVLFMLPSIDIDTATLSVKVNDVATAVTIVPVPFFKKYTPTGSFSGRPSFYDDETFMDTNTASGQEAIKKYAWDGTQLIQVFNRSITPTSYPYFARVDLSPLAYIYPAAEKLYVVKDIDTLDTLYTVTPNSTGRYRFVEDNIFFFIDNLNYGTFSWNAIYTLNNGATWQTKNVISNFINTDYMSDKVSYNKTRKIAFQGTGSSGTTAFRLLSLNTATVALSAISCPTATASSFGEFNPLGTLLATFGTHAGIYTFEEVGGVWTRTDIFPDSAPVVYTGGWFIGSNYFLAFNSTQYSIWVKSGSAWFKAINNGTIDSLTEVALSYNMQGNTVSPNGLLAGFNSYTVNGIAKGALSKTAIQFATAPLATDEIKVTYTVKGIHKTANYVVDVSGYIQFGS